MLTLAAAITYSHTQAREIRESLDQLGIYPAALLPHNEQLHQMTMAEVAEELDAEVPHLLPVA